MAQVEISDQDIPVEAGLVSTYYSGTDTTDGIDFEIQAADEDLEWDFTGIVLDDAANDTLVDPEDAPDAETFANANRVVLTSAPLVQLGSGAYYQYEAVTDSGWFLLGFAPQDREGVFGQAISLQDNPPLISPMPMEYNMDWEIVVTWDTTLEAQEDWGEAFALIDSVKITVEIGGNGEIDAWGVGLWDGGESDVLRHHISLGGEVVLTGIKYVWGQRFEAEIPGYEIVARRTCRWFAPELGEVASAVSMRQPDDDDWQVGTLRVLTIPPILEFSAESIDFVFVEYGDSAMVELIVTNFGDGQGIISELAVADTLEGDFRIEGELPRVIDANYLDTLRIWWKPQVEIDLEGYNLRLWHNDPVLDNPLWISLSGSTPFSVGIDLEPLPSSSILLSAYPNPFNSSTTISFNLPQAGDVKLTVYDMQGTSFRNRQLHFCQQPRRTGGV